MQKEVKQPNVCAGILRNLYRFIVMIFGGA